MKTELLALIDELVKFEIYVAKGKFSAAKDAKRIRADIVALLGQPQAPEFDFAAKLKLEDLLARGYTVSGLALEKPAVDGQPERGFITAGGFVGWWRDRSPAVVEPVAYLHDDGYWTAAKTEQGRALSDRLHFAGSPKIGVHLHPAPTTKAEPADALDAKRLDFVERSRVALVPEFEGPWEALVYKDDAEPVVAGEGNTPRAAIDAAIAAQAAQINVGM